MDIGEWLAGPAIAHRSSADSKRQALAVVADVAARAFTQTRFSASDPAVKAADVLAALLEREEAGSTGMGRGVALPHARLPGLDRMRAVFVRLDQPVAFDAVDDQPVDLLFALFAPENASSAHLRALARVSAPEKRRTAPAAPSGPIRRRDLRPAQPDRRSRRCLDFYWRAMNGIVIAPACVKRRVILTVCPTRTPPLTPINIRCLPPG